MKLNVKEIFYSLQGEGGRQGAASIFIRLAKCNLDCDFCDTDFEEGTAMSLDNIALEIAKYPSKWIIWTGGEPLLQLKEAHLDFFFEQGYQQALETNGTRKIPDGIDYITCSPKKDYDRVKALIFRVDEIRLPIKVGDDIPSTDSFPKATRYFLSPIFDGEKPVKENIDYCIKYALAHPEWELSLQIHKLINIR